MNSVNIEGPLEDEDVKLTEAENEQNRHAYSVALVTAMAAEAAIAAANAAAQVVRLRAAVSSKSKEDVAALKIQTVFRGYLVHTYMLVAIYFDEVVMVCLIFDACLSLGKESIEGFEGSNEAKISDWRKICETSSNFHTQVHADNVSCPISDPR